MGTVKLKSSDEVFQLKISLLGSDPEIWRTIQISSAATLSRLHKAIQSAFDWEDSHLHEFTTIKHEKINKRQKLKEVLRVGKKIIYTYDFGDCWEHLITVESRQSPDLNKKYSQTTLLFIQDSKKTRNNSSTESINHSLRLRLTHAHICSIGFKSGLYAGSQRILCPCCSNNS